MAGFAGRPAKRVTLDAGKVTIRVASIQWTGSNRAQVQAFAPDAVITSGGAVCLPGRDFGYATWADPGDYIVRDALGCYAQSADVFTSGTLAAS